MAFSKQFPSTTRRSFLKGAGMVSAAAVTGSFPIPAIAQAQEVTMISAENNGAALDALKAIAASFSKEAGVNVVINNMDHEAHKTAIRNYLVAGAPDICSWFSGNRMRAFVKRGLFDDISDLFEKEKYKDVLGATAGAVTDGGKQYGLPTGGTLWGMFYRKDVFEQHGLTVPKTADEFMAYGDKCKAAGITPVAIGTKELWPAAGWFDQMNLRVNGLDKHMALMNGEMSYLDPSLTAVFDQWEAMISKGFFTENHTSFGWQEAAALLAQKKAGMMNLGAFLRSAFTAEDLPQLSYATFPVLDAKVGHFEEFSVNSIHIPAKAKNKQGAREFLAYFYKPENLAAYLEPAGNVPPRSDLPPSKDPLVNVAVETMKTVQGTSQYYDRDSDPDMAQAGLVGFQEFMAKPDRRKAILTRLEGTRKRIYKI
ncbi:carbohydrate ABC transporter substrate-binding protein [Rhizobium leguminosarum]|uniref:ABC transporter substrate-binding protein n=1 Tax=Rhizobium leguminosarum TaxID=384 RepID=UPI001C98521D|nr:ABC transporter substrate-binding protein [Rhizobium leguminosarum]MBY5782531.1 carbohydrate ABC transporter substrate-binding protein [Rhizobium leguminosarum]